ncbi:hypothetical protein J2S17_005291 [Cytobacillus purgationiresistens]|uniref:Stage II sporulation protein M n=1 Tax=Cytobacillus purgationiresistens TaxID=863449 RepID=A0ABU0APZ9_9BACI|nr:hypothetical protein [Cytobacillus purgationiresistens]
MPLISGVYGFVHNEYFLKEDKSIILIEETGLFLLGVIFFVNLLMISIYYLLSFIGVAFIAISFFFYKIGNSISIYDSNLLEFLISMPHVVGEIFVCFQVLYLNYKLIINRGVDNEKGLFREYKINYLLTILVLLLSGLVETYISPYLIETFMGG